MDIPALRQERGSCAGDGEPVGVADPQGLEPAPRLGAVRVTILLVPSETAMANAPIATLVTWCFTSLRHC